MRELEQQASLDLDGLDDELLEDLASQSLSELRKQRADTRIDFKLRVSLSPGNSSQRHEPLIDGHTKDISPGGCRAILPAPPQVGDIYLMKFESDQLCLPRVFARCLRCRLVREEAFEASFQFFNSIEIPEVGGQSSSDLFD